MENVRSAAASPGIRSRGVLVRSFWPLLLSLTGFILTGCAWVQLEPRSGRPAPAKIIFVTPTPSDQIVLNEGQRAQTLPTPGAIPQAYYAGANELGQILVLEYHHIGYPEQRYQRTPDNLRADLQRLYQQGYYPVNFIDIIRGLPEVPAGKKPVVLTFDDSAPSQFRVLDDQTIDADSAVGILLNFHNQHPTGWPKRATFFVLGNDTADYQSLFGQPEWAKAKVKMLVELGMEIGSHTVSHADLSAATAERIYWELAVSQRVIEEIVPGYKVQSLSVPFGGFPYTLEFLKAGQWGDFNYTYAGNAAAWGGPTVSPFDSTFEPYHVSRLEITATSIDYWLNYFEQNPHEYYTADGDPSRVTFPGVEMAAGNKPD